MTGECKKFYLELAYLAMLMDIACFGGIIEGKTVTIKETGEVYTFEQLKEMFR